jgi:two-component sensor histidine kinase
MDAVSDTSEGSHRDDDEHRARVQAEVESHDIIAREMRHRLKNLLAIVASIARLTGRQAERTDEFLPIFSRRVGDLAAAQHLLTENSDQRADLPGLIDILLSGDDRDKRIRVGAIPAVRLEEHSTRVVALVIGELLTNAQKYGALSGDGGTVDLAAESGDKRVDFIWTETCERPVVSPAAVGSGTILMQRMTSREPQPLHIDWRDGGIVARFAVRA